MSDYTVSPAKLQELNVIIDKGGHVPGDVSNALAELQIAMVNGDKAAADVAFNKAVQANITGNAACWTAAQQWHDSVKQEVPIPPPPAVPGQLTAGQAQERLFPVVSNQICQWVAMTDLKWSYAVSPSGGVPAFYYVGSEYLTNTADPRWKSGGAGSIPWVQMKAGQKASAYFGAGAPGPQTLRVDAYAP